LIHVEKKTVVATAADAADTNAVKSRRPRL